MTRRMYARMLVVWLGLTGLAGATFTLTKEGDRYDLVADHADLREVLAAIDRHEVADLRFFGEPEGTVRLSVYRQTLDQLLSRLGVSFALVYRQDRAGNVTLDDAILLDSWFQNLDPETLATLKAAARDLYDDDVYYNAHSAIYVLVDYDCEILSVLLAPKLSSDDYQARHLAALVLRQSCGNSTNAITEDLLTASVDLLGRDGYNSGEFWSLFSASDPYHYFYNYPDMAEKARGRLHQKVFNGDPQARFLSAAILAGTGSKDFPSLLVNILVGHLKDNDIKTDGSVAAYALYHLGATGRPFLEPYRSSSDTQQAELVNLILRALDEGTPDVAFDPEMYAGTSVNPLIHRPSPRTHFWDLEDFPDEQGHYAHLDDFRQTAADHYYWTSIPPYPADLAHDDLTPYGDSSPREEPTRMDSVEPFPYIIKNNDSLYTISRTFGVSVQQLHAANPDLAGREATLGMRILIPWID